eukprot:TRINITY_DN10838_c0_g1_i2.p3 TRINITY_DN10838_c0_g1~~TRINITY_DN10838_c0_g1_i2.p3  ORF type:complete len:261 (+),score=23.84 TRINITY_DN10838_c0_g1_i2:2521-3303(+)
MRPHRCLVQSISVPFGLGPSSPVRSRFICPLVSQSWNLTPNPEAVKTMLGTKIREEAMRAYLFSVSGHYDAISLKTLATKFELDESKEKCALGLAVPCLPRSLVRCHVDPADLHRSVTGFIMYLRCCFDATKYRTLRGTHPKHPVLISVGRVHGLTSKMIFVRELHGSHDQPSSTITMRQQEPTGLQRLALNFAERVRLTFDVLAQELCLTPGRVLTRAFDSCARSASLWRTTSACWTSSMAAMATKTVLRATCASDGGK